MTTPRNRKKSDETSTLFEALKFVSVAQSKEGYVYQTHTLLDRGWAIAFDGMISAGMKINEDLSACPQTKFMLEAMARAGKNFSIVQYDRSKLIFKNDVFEVIVPCASGDTMQSIKPDAPEWKADDNLLKALEAVAFLAKDDAQLVATAAILARSGSCAATDGRVLLEYWHGLSLPTMLLPKGAVTAVCRAGKPLAALGHSDASATFYFDDGSWIKTQLMEGRPVEFGRVLDVKSNAWPVPASFFEGVRAVLPFSQDGVIIFGSNIIRSHEQDGIGATFKLNGIPNGPRFNGKYLLQCEPYMKYVDFIGQKGIAYFFGAENVRGAIAGVAVPVKPTIDPNLGRGFQARQQAQREEAENKPWTPADNLIVNGKVTDDEVPF